MRMNSTLKFAILFVTFITITQISATQVLQNYIIDNLTEVQEIKKFQLQENGTCLKCVTFGVNAYFTTSFCFSFSPSPECPTSLAANATWNVLSEDNSKYEVKIGYSQEKNEKCKHMTVLVKGETNPFNGFIEFNKPPSASVVSFLECKKGFNKQCFVTAKIKLCLLP